MAHKISRRLESLLDHYASLCLALTLVTLSLIGVGDICIVSLLGLFLCAAGITQKSARVDFWVLIPLIFYVLAAMASSFAAYGNIVDGYGAMHAIFPVLYLLMACLKEEELHLLRRCCILWTGCMAAAGIVQFVFQAVIRGRAVRMASLLGNPNGTGIFLVVGWFALMYCAGESRGERGWGALLPRLEPVMLIALALTLSMGSFLAMAAGIVVLLIEKKRDVSWGETFRYACRLLARAVLGMGTGLLIYLAAARTSVPWSCLFLLAYGAAVTAYWKIYERFLEAYPRAALVISALGILVAGVIAVIRPSAAATFAERLEMMGSGLGYLTVSPLFGVGPFRWRMLDLKDGGKYFNTWHIHNIPIHVGVEMGWIAMVMVILTGVRALCKKKDSLLKAGTASFLFHNMIDTSFFYLGITAMTLMAAGEPKAGGKEMGGRAVKALFALYAGLFVYSLCQAI